MGAHSLSAKSEGEGIVKVKYKKVHILCEAELSTLNIFKETPFLIFSGHHLSYLHPSHHKFGGVGGGVRGDTRNNITEGGHGPH